MSQKQGLKLVSMKCLLKLASQSQSKSEREAPLGQGFMSVSQLHCYHGKERLGQSRCSVNNGWKRNENWRGNLTAYNTRGYLGLWIVDCVDRGQFVDVFSLLLLLNNKHRIWRHLLAVVSASSFLLLRWDSITRNHNGGANSDFKLISASAVWRGEKGEHYPVTKPVWTLK